MSLREFTVPSSVVGTDLHCMEWSPESPVATLQIAHGMIEHIARYEPLALHLNGLGIAVIGHDHLGHGRTSPDDHGTIAESDGDEHLVEDLYLVTQRIDSDHPGIPHFILGHSMGSYVVRRYITRYGDMVDGVVLVGTGNQPPAVVGFARFLANTLVRMKGPRYVSPMLNRMVLENYDKRFREPDMRNRWLSRDPAAIEAYNSDPFCSFKFTVSGYRDLFTLIGKDVCGQDIERIPKGLPVILLSGSEDPVGDDGKGVEKARRLLEKAGLHPEMKLYEGARHELMNETNRDEVYADIGAWLSARVSQRSPPERTGAPARRAAVGAHVSPLGLDPGVPVSAYDQVGPLEPGLGQSLPDRLDAVFVDPRHRHRGIAPVLGEPLQAGLAESLADTPTADRRRQGDGVHQAYPDPGPHPVPVSRVGERQLLGL